MCDRTAMAEVKQHLDEGSTVVCAGNRAGAKRLYTIRPALGVLLLLLMKVLLWRLWW